MLRRTFTLTGGGALSSIRRMRSNEPLALRRASGAQPPALRPAPDAATATPVLCAPGLSANARSFDLIAATLAESGHPVVAFDLRGRGLSPATAPGTHGW